MDIFLYLVILYSLISVGEGSCCLKFLDEKCVECEIGMHIFRDNCIYDVKNCQTYKDGFECEKCKQGFTLSTNKCTQILSSANQSSNSSTSTSTTSTNNSSNPNTLQYKVVEIDFKNLQTIKDIDMVDEFSISDEIFRSNYANEVKSAQILKAEQRKYPNGTIHILIDYRNSKKEIYNGTIMVNIKTFIFKVISFEMSDVEKIQKQQQNQKEKEKQQQTQNISSQPIQKQQLPSTQLFYTIAFTPLNNSFTFPESLTTQDQVDFLNNTQLQIMSKLDQKALNYLNQQTKKQPQKKIFKKQKQNSNQTTVLKVTEMGRAEMRRYDNGKEKKQFMTIEYLTNDNFVGYLVVGEVIDAVNNDAKESVRLVYAGFDKEKLAKKQGNNQQKPTNNSESATSNNNNKDPKNNTATPQIQQTKPQQPKLPQLSQSSSQSSPQLSPSQVQALIGKMQFRQISDELQLLNDIYFMISKDEVRRKLKQYQDVAPQKVLIASIDKSNKNSANQQIQRLKNSNYYKLIYVVKDLTAQVIVRCNLTTYEPKVEKVKYITANQTKKQNNGTVTGNLTANGITTTSTPSGSNNTNNNNTNSTSNTPTTPKPSNSTSTANSSTTNSSSSTLTPKAPSTTTKQSITSPKLPDPPTTNQSTTNPPASSPPKTTFPIPANFTLCNNSITSNIYYLIAMDSLTSKDTKYLNIKPLETYLKNQSNSSKLQLLFKFELTIKNQSKQLWIVIIDVFQSSFRAQISKNQLVQKIPAPTILNQQSDPNQSLKKDELTTKNPTFPPPIGQGRVILLKMNKQRILVQEVKIKANLRSLNDKELNVSS